MRPYFESKHVTETNIVAIYPYSLYKVRDKQIKIEKIE